MDLESDSIVNYVWVNDTPFCPDMTDESAPLCGVPLHYLDCALENAHKYPNAAFNVWFDFDFLDDTSRLFIDSVIYFSGCQNVTVKNLRDIDLYTQTSLFDKDTYYEHPSGLFGKQPYCKYARADLARVIVLKHITDAALDQRVFYCDFDVDDIALNNPNIEKPLTENGMVFGNTQDDHIENGYMGFIKSKLLSQSGNVDYINGLFKRTRNDAVLNEKGWKALKKTLLGAGCIDDVTVDGLLHERGYKIPKPPHYTDYKIC